VKDGIVDFMATLPKSLKSLADLSRSAWESLKVFLQDTVPESEA